MSLLNKAKAQVAEDDARKAWDEGDDVLVLRVWDEVFSYQGTGRVKPASEALERALAIGWQLEHAAYSWVDKKDRGVLVCILRRSAVDRLAANA